MDQDQWTLKKADEKEKAKSQLGLRCLEKKEANLGASCGDYEMRDMEKIDLKTFCSVLGLESVLAFFKETEDFKWFETVVVLSAVFIALAVLMQFQAGLKTRTESPFLYGSIT